MSLERDRALILAGSYSRAFWLTAGYGHGAAEVLSRTASYKPTNAEGSAVRIPLNNRRRRQLCPHRL